ncbi:hypothetical protein Ccrd_008648, partial [Cynara cardunculus var. scolymus]
MEDKRSAAEYIKDEDKLLCQVYMQIAQDPIKGVYQTSDQFWSRVEGTYNNEKDTTWTVHPKRSLQSRSLQSRVLLIEKATRKLHACIRQYENRHQSGASNDIIKSNGCCQKIQNLRMVGNLIIFWSIIKEFEKFHDGNTRTKQIPIPIPNRDGFGCVFR